MNISRFLESTTICTTFYFQVIREFAMMNELYFPPKMKYLLIWQADDSK